MDNRINGIIKWYSKSKEFGIIYSDDYKNNNIFFNLKNIKKSFDDRDEENECIIPENGDYISFIPYERKNEIYAKKIEIKKRLSNYIICSNCKEKIIPLILFENNRRKKDVGIGSNSEFYVEEPCKKKCPNCDYTIEEFKTIYNEINKYNKYTGILSIIILSCFLYSLLKILSSLN